MITLTLAVHLNLRYDLFQVPRQLRDVQFGPGFVFFNKVAAQGRQD